MARATRTARTMVVIAVVVAAVLGVWGRASAGLLWNLETVDNPANLDVGDQSTIALDASGLPHIAYRDSSNRDVKYAKKSALLGTWKIETIDQAGDAGWGVSMVLDASGTPHVTYYRQGDGAATGDVIYAKRQCVIPPDSFCTWSKTTVEAGVFSTYLAGNTSLVLDAGGTLHVSYFDHTHGQLKWAKLLSWGWSIADVIATPGGRTSLAVDADGFPHVGFSHNMTGVRYAKVTCYFILCGWTYETVDYGGLGTLKLDGAGNARVAYWGYGGLRYAARVCVGSGSSASCSWSREAVAMADPFHVSLVLDPTGAPRIGYMNRTSGNFADVRYAVKSGGFWSSHLVDWNGEYSTHVSVALDSNGYPHLTYKTWTSTALGHATGTPPLVVDTDGIAVNPGPRAP